jgi:hypothetical protein
MMTLAPLVVAALVSAAGPDLVESSELSRRPELVGREVVVDDRVRYFLESKRGQGYDELMLRRTDVLFKIPGRLKFSRSPSEPNVRVQGTLKVIEGRLTCEVSAIEMLPNDLTRLEGELRKLRPEDWQGQRTWALWAERRGKELNESKLQARGVALEGEALWLEAAQADADNLGLAARSSGRPIPDSLRNALAHRGFRDRFSKATTPDEWEALARQVEAMLPASADPKAAVEVEPSLLDAYAKDPASAYRDAPAGARASLDRRLLADAIQRSLEKQLEARPIDAAKLAEVARDRLPDRPALVDRLGRQGLVEAEARVASMRQSEVEELAARFRERGEEDRSKRLIQSWLADRRKNRLSASDAEGRVLLAGTYEKLAGDRATAAELLREALDIDRQSKTAVDAFLRMGFRKGETGWYDPNSARSNPVSAPEPGRRGGENAASAEPGESLRGLTRSQVRNRLGGKPDLVVRSASQGRSVEQWIYKNGKGTQVVRFVYEPGTSEPRASAYYSDQK